MVERLCDFLAKPSAEMTVGGAKASKKSKSKKKKQEEEEEDETEDEESEDEEEEGGLPSKKKLRKWVKAYLTVFNGDNVSIKHCLETASQKFGVDMTEMKPTIKLFLTEML